eukprot:SAG22_NODE_372_length_11551_cov_20.656741_9_plen_170_part_00
MGGPVSCGCRNPVPELVGLRSGTLASEHVAVLPVNSPHVIAKTGAGAAASSDVVLTFSGFKTTAADTTFGACFLGNGTSGSGVGVTVSVYAGSNGTHLANVASGPCKVGGGAIRGAAVTIFAGEATVLSFHCLSLCFSAFPCGSTALIEDRCNQTRTSLRSASWPTDRS